MWSTQEEMLKAADDVLKLALSYGYVSIGSELQEEAIANVKSLQLQIKQHQKKPLPARMRNRLTWLGLLGVLQMASAFLSMWVHIKNDQMESAWNALINAQDNLEAALKLRHTEGLSRLNHNLQAIEKVLFPPCMFVSSSIFYESTDWSSPRKVDSRLR